MVIYGTWINLQSIIISHGQVYLIQISLMKFVSNLKQVCVFLRVLLFPPQIKLTPLFTNISKLMVLKIRHLLIF